MVGGLIISIWILVFIYGIFSLRPTLPFLMYLYITISLLVFCYDLYQNGSLVWILLIITGAISGFLGLLWLIFSENPLTHLSDPFVENTPQNKKNIICIMIFFLASMWMIVPFL